MKKYNFIKAHGLGNDFVIFLEDSYINLTDELVRYISDRKKGIGCDLVVCLKQSDATYSDLETTFFNKDGSEAEVCGNALRCVGKYYLEKLKKSNTTIETKAGLIDIEMLRDGMIAVDLGKPNLNWNKIPIRMEMDTKNLGFNLKYLKEGFSVNVGNPHVIFFVEKIDQHELCVDSKKILESGLFPEGVNISAVKKISENQLNVITLERGVGITSACGSGAGASAYASHKLKYCGNRVNVQMTGGNLNIEITKDDHILTTGDSKEIFKGEIVF